MKKNWFSQLIVILVVAAMILSIVGCQPTEPVNTDEPKETEQGTTPVETAAPVAEPTYTYNAAMGASPTTWNPHTWETDADNSLAPYIETQLVDVTIAEDGVNFEWLYEASTAVTDVTATFAGRDEWGITEEENKVYQIDLNPDLCWEDGTPINADSYIYSMQQLLDPAMKNYRANSYFVGSSAILGAAGYYNNDKVGQPTYGPADGVEATEYYLSLTNICVFFGDGSAKDYYEAGYSSYFVDAATGTDLFAKYIDGDEYQLVTEEMIADLQILVANFGDTNPDNWKQFCFVVDGVFEETPWEKVGLLKTGDYQLTYILETPETMFYFLTSLTGTWLVNEELYEAGKSTVENLVATNYETSAETTMSFGPYKLASFEVDKQMVFEKNENWFGYTDGKHEGQYMTTTVKVDIISDHNTQMQLFNQGQLDEVELAADDMSAYRMSDYLLKTDQTYTYRFIFATDLAALTALEDEANDGANKKVLSYDDFRKALSLSIDRSRMAAEATSAYKPAYFLLNYLYYYDVENNPESIYRNSTEAKEAVLRLYGIEYGDGKTYATVDEAFAAVTGYDVEAARALFQAVYEQAIADGNYTEGQAVHITCMASAAATMDADTTRQQDLMNEFVTAATVGTGFEGKITFTFQSGAADRYQDVANGRVEMIRGAWGGAAFYPFSTIRVYTEPDYMGGIAAIHESCGWDPTVETLDITYDFDGDGTAETMTDTFQNWAKSINNGTYTDAADKLAVLSNLESGILASYQCIPWSTETICSLYSKQIQFATLDYNIMYAYGGIRLMTYNYSDADWDAYVAEQGGTLNYE